MLSKIFSIFAVAAALLTVTGCQELRLTDGKYETTISGREDFAAVYGELIFLRVRNPEEDGTRGGYWDWAGKYSVGTSNRIYLDMDEETARRWNFHFDFYRQRNSITVADLGNDTSYDLYLRPAQTPEVRARMQRAQEAEEDQEMRDTQVYR